MWFDVRYAARIARDEGVQIVVHGVAVSASIQIEPQEQPRQQPRDWSSLRQPMEPVAPVQPRSDIAPNTPQTMRKREQRSQDRLSAFNSKRRRQLIASSPRIQTFLKQFRWNRMQQVWIPWKQQQQQQKQQQQQQQEAAARRLQAFAHVKAARLKAAQLRAARLYCETAVRLLAPFYQSCHSTDFYSTLQAIPSAAVDMLTRMRTRRRRERAGARQMGGSRTYDPVPRL